MGATLLTNYFTTTEIILIGAAILVGIAGLVILWIKMPKKKHIDWKKSVSIVLLTVLCTLAPP